MVWAQRGNVTIMIILAALQRLDAMFYGLESSVGTCLACIHVAAEGLITIALFTSSYILEAPYY